MPPATRRPATRKPRPAAKPGPQLAPALLAAASELAIALRPLLRQVLAASDQFHAVVTAQTGDSYAVGGTLDKGVRESWDVLSWWMEEAKRISEGEGPTR